MVSVCVSVRQSLLASVDCTPLSVAKTLMLMCDRQFKSIVPVNVCQKGNARQGAEVSHQKFTIEN